MVNLENTVRRVSVYGRVYIETEVHMNKYSWYSGIINKPVNLLLIEFQAVRMKFKHCN